MHVVSDWLGLLIQAVTLGTLAVGFIHVLKKQEETHVSLNSRLTELVDSVRKESHQAGRAEAEAEAKDRKDRNENWKT
jgi:hypothetical protein